MRGMNGPLSSVWNVPPATPEPPTRVWRDWVLVAVLPMLIVLESVLRPDLPNLVAAAVITAAGVATVMWRRAWPLLMFVIGFGSASVFALVTGHEVQLYSSAYLLLLVYAVFRWGSGRAMLVGGAIMVASTLTSTLRAPFELADLVGSFLFLLVTISLGLLMRLRVGWRLRDIDRAKSHEREELARDLHDTVAHHVSAIAIQAQAGLATVESNPDAATAALRVIEAEASRTLTEMRSMVRVLRRDDAVELAPQPTVADLRALADSDGGGPTISVQLDGPFDELAAPVASAVFRIVQESVTNALRHARAVANIEVRVDVGDEWVHLTVLDDGESGSPGAPGYGITGMTERASLLGGTCTAERSPDGGWRVVADLPRTGAVA